MNFTLCGLYERGPPLNTFPIRVFGFFQLKVVLSGRENVEVDSHLWLFPSSDDNIGVH